MSVTYVGRGLGWLTSLRSTASADPVRCTRRLGSECTDCRDECPATAIRVEAGAAPIVDPLACIGCGLCAAACPADAFEGVGSSPERLVLAAHGAGDRLAVRCGRAGSREEAGSSGFVQDVFCLGALHPETVAAAAAGITDGGTLELLSAGCTDCPVGAGRQVDHVVESGRALASRVAPAVKVARREVGSEPELLPETETETKDPTAGRRRRWLGRRRPANDPVSVSRRELFTTLTGQPADLAAREVPASPAGDVRRVAVPGAVSRPRGTLLAAASRVPLPRPHVEDGCTACRACSNACPTDALLWGDWATTSGLGVDPQACIACGECVRVCPEEVVSLVCDLQPRRVGATVSLAHVTHSTCARCGDALGPGEAQTCTRCRSRESIVADVWAQYGLG